jgi:predicted RNA-binding protein with PIN domain
MRILLVLMFVSLLIISCSLEPAWLRVPTPYGRQGTIGGDGVQQGYKDAHIRDNIYYVEVCCNYRTDRETAAQYFERRASELCTENGYQSSRTYNVQDTSGTASQMTDFRSGVGSGNSAGLAFTDVERVYPGFSGYVECSRTNQSK